jgi:hypothetical protein
MIGKRAKILSPDHIEDLLRAGPIAQFHAINLIG